VEERRFARHPSDVPIEVEYDAGERPSAITTQLRDVGLGGLSLRFDHQLDVNAFVKVRIPLAQSPFETRGEVVWCRQANGAFEVGIRLTDAGQAFRARMVEQICQIEHYRKEVFASEGRQLTGQEAALEWITKYAADFPRE